MKKYAIWNKQDPVITPVGEVLSAEKWIERYPVAGVPSVTVVCAAGEINGAFFSTMGQMVTMYESQGCDFSTCITPEEKLAAIESFEDKKETEAREKANSKAAMEAELAELNASSLASIAAQLEFQNMMSLDDVEEE